MEGVAARMHPDEAVTVLNPFEESVTVRNGQITCGVGKNNRINSLQMVQRELLTHIRVIGAVGPTTNVIHHGEFSGRFTQSGNHILGGCDGAMAKAFGGRDDDDFFRGGFDSHPAGQRQGDGQLRQFHEVEIEWNVSWN